MFSIIIPTYNSESTIYKTLHSILNQTYSNFEILIIDNYSSDQTLKIVGSFADDRIKLHQNNNDGMPAVSRNLGISLSKYEYLAFCDSDDCWNENKLEICKSYADKGFNFISHNLTLTGSSKMLFYKNFFKRKSSNSLESFIKNGNHIAQSSVVIKKDILNLTGLYSTDKKFIAIEDAHLWLRIFSLNEKMAYINLDLGSYHYSDSALSFKANQFISNRALRLEFFRGTKPAWYKYNIATYLLRTNKKNKASHYLKSIIFSSSGSIELRLKSIYLMIKICVH